MILVLLSIVITLVAFYFIFKLIYDKDLYSFIGAVILWLIFSILVNAIIGGSLLGIVSYYAQIDPVLKDTKKIVAMKNNMVYDIEKSGEENYVVMIKENESYRVELFDKEITSITLVNNNYRIETYDFVFHSEIMRFLFFDPLFFNQERYIIYIPKNSIVEGFKIELQN